MKRNRKLNLVILITLVLGAGVPAPGTVAAPLEAGYFNRPLMLKDANTGSGSGDPNYFEYNKGKVFYTVNDSTYGIEPYVTDGTPEGTHLLKDINASGNSNPMDFARYNGKVYFSAFESTHGNEMWVTNGTEAGTKLAVDIIPGATGSYPYGFTAYKGLLYFSSASAATGYELWRTDGTPANTEMVFDSYPGTGSTSPQDFYVSNGKLYFRGSNAANGQELWVFDGNLAPSATNPKMVADLYVGASSSLPNYYIGFDNKLLFSGSDGLTTYGREIFQTDGSSISIYEDLYAGTSSSTPWDKAVLGNKLITSALQPSIGRELVVMDGVSSPVVIEVRSGVGSGNPAWFAVTHRKVYFRGDDGTYGQELWVTDGTGAGTHIAYDYLGGELDPTYVYSTGRGIIFQGTTAAEGGEAWMYFPDRIFHDGFESGDLSAWSGANGADFNASLACNLCTTTTGPLHGTTSLRVKIPNRNPHYVENVQSLITKYNARFKIKLGNTLKMGNLHHFVLFLAKSGNKTPLQLQVRKMGTKFQIRALAKLDNGNQAITMWTALPKKATLVEVDWAAAKGISKHNGYVKLFINNKLKQKKTGLDNDTITVGTIRLGIADPIQTAFNISGSFLLDYFDSDSFGHVGP